MSSITPPPTSLSRTDSLSGRLADAILDLIRTDGLTTGDAIPSARTLASRFEVTTPTIREALRQLEATGAVELRHGSGTYVGPTIDRAVMVNPHRAPLTKESVLELIGARELIEPDTAAAAALARTDDQLRRLELASGNALNPPGDRPVAYHFHIELAAATGNRLMRELIESLILVRGRQQRAIRRLYDERERDHREHLEILAAVHDRDPAQARQLTRDHLAHIREAISSADLQADAAAADGDR
ncbi:FadR/GntR family transcriptional regulator [Microlunatus soli]|uniref:FadR/GntR family transcriptional regulator n=1 Tax=Microlunatus soli TaxID=630515 RepID=UPI001E53B560|nr:GntR family transcriptional regulator [Microlunatus soli]